MTFMYRLTLDCAHFMLHGPVKQAAQIFVGEDAVCEICPPSCTWIPEGTTGKMKAAERVYPTRIIVNIEEVPEDLLPAGLF